MAFRINEDESQNLAMGGYVYLKIVRHVVSINQSQTVAPSETSKEKRVV